MQLYLKETISFYIYPIRYSNSEGIYPYIGQRIHATQHHANYKSAKIALQHTSYTKQKVHYHFTITSFANVITVTCEIFK